RDDDVLRRYRDAELALIIVGDDFAETRQPRRCAVMCRAGFDGVEAGVAGGACAGKGAVADLQFDDVLPGGFEALGDGEYVERGFATKIAGEGTEGKKVAHGGMSKSLEAVCPP